MTDTTSASSFSSLPLAQALLQNLDSLGFNKMTPIQAASLPQVLEGRDVIGQASTGSGKTVAFGLGLLHALDVQKFAPQGLVLCPTRELADQVAGELRRLARSIHNIKILTLCGGGPFGAQVASLKHGAHIVVGTPGRIEEHVRKGHLNTRSMSMLVLDEADRMLDMGFQDTLTTIVSALPGRRQTLLFSATFPEQIERMAKGYMTEPVFVKVQAERQDSTIEQRFFKIEDSDRSQALRQILSAYFAESMIVFCTTKRETQEVADTLSAQGFAALALHGDLEQRERDYTLVRFANKSANVLVATDVAARGLDISALDLVVNYHLSRDPEVHVHRIGRTGRAGAQGLACSIYSDREIGKLIRIEEEMGESFFPEKVPEAPTRSLPEPSMITLQIDGGKKQKVRPGDIVGCLTGEGGIDNAQIGKINVFDFSAFVAVERQVYRRALKKIETGKLKGRRFRVRVMK
ncbi:ATP-dependent RNA helicase DbpA [Gilvimarinus sp. SDUM040013]|uniref:ATP-dependent RNA helicase DbpA n=1 Tax=Gilvimarinus gilvus TaxID=3058038 RepID=A0ABU4RSG0_9GAMM|nr:ATP-dependent RNA helicase DbpA [Gilvimarinus sp. SDUM040013]MDO3388275.1 ATP-dependent RNA helicase DbpA [Gilvimarinus sp. SDUM040013]MDX6847825.1 ATP-dependent RNA helicase DbpA [Gilvimarinus sp. SDUM040013]